jgi:dTDP-4-dehydrorhamnose 3,5-epimerase
MQVERLAIPEVLLLTPRRHGDERGWFAETYNQDVFAKAGLSDDFVQDNHAYSSARGAVRGLHLQVPPHAIAKLVRVVRGAVFDVAVDVRAGSPTYGLWVSAELSAENGRQLYVPRGFAHGYCTLTADAEVLYKQSGLYAPRAERGVRWDDPAIGVRWPISAGEAILNDRDRTAPLLSSLEPCAYS